MGGDEGALALEIRGVSKSFGTIAAVRNCTLKVQRGEIVALLGPSGCGKSTLLGLIAGFHRQDSGTIFIDGRVADALPPNLRETSKVFQHYALFPHLRVFDNIAYGLRSRKLPVQEIESRVAELVSMLKLDGLERRFPAELSGGQMQRVAVARALAVRPKLLLLDEAFSALDKNLRESMQLELTLLLRRLHITTVHVTHDQREAFTVADRIAVMQSGSILQVGTPQDLYRVPRTSFIMEFLGTANRIAARPGADGLVVTDIGVSLPLKATSTVRIYLRAEDTGLSRSPTAAHPAKPGRVELATFLGSTQRYVVSWSGAQIVSEQPSGTHEPFRVGEAVYLDLDPARCTLVDDDSTL